MALFDSISDKINALMEDLGKSAAEHWGSYLIVVLAVTLGGVFSVIFGWSFAVFAPLFILCMGFATRNRYKRNIEK